MVNWVSSLTWRHPKLVLAGIGVFVIAAAIFGRGVEEHLKAAGFTDPASESERATEHLRDGLGYDANPGLSCSSATATTRSSSSPTPRSATRSSG